MNKWAVLIRNRGVAIYSRKSRITYKGDSIGVQFKQCAEYAKRELRLDENYNFMEYEDKGLSGYYSSHFYELFSIYRNYFKFCI